MTPLDRKVAQLRSRLSRTPKQLAEIHALYAEFVRAGQPFPLDLEEHSLRLILEFVRPDDLEAARRLVTVLTSQGKPVPDDLRARVAGADAFVHVQDLPETDLLLAQDYAAHEAGFAAAQALTGGKAALYHLDATRPDRPHARPLTEEIARVVRARAAKPKWMAGMMQHGFRGGAEIAATLDHLAAFAHLAQAVPPQLFDLYHDATLGTADVRDFLARENPEALAAMEERFAALRAAGLWATRRNSILAGLEHG